MSKTIISKQTFLDAYNAYQPNKFVNYVFKYFSTNVKQENKWLNNLLLILLIFLFLAGFVFTALNVFKYQILIITIAYVVLLLLLVVTIGIAVLINNHRITKIRKKLDVSLQEYDQLVTKFLDI
jgi:uncharacterized membrane protein